MCIGIEAIDWRRATAAGLSLRDACDDDFGFLRRLYATTRASELAPVPWTTEQKAAFVAMQFDAQHSHYVKHYSGLRRLVALIEGEPVGRLYLDYWKQEIRIVDIALMPAHCGRGLGSALLGDVVSAAARLESKVSIHVEKHNPAGRLYRRLGFVHAEDKGVYDLLHWTGHAANADPDRPVTTS